MNPDSHPLVVSVCYIRIAASELHASARFAADIFGLQRVAEKNGEIAFRSDNRFRTLSLSNGLRHPSIYVWASNLLNSAMSLTSQSPLRRASAQWAPWGYGTKKP